MRNYFGRGTRRSFILAAAAWPALTWMRMAVAQSKQKPVVIGWLLPGSRQVNGDYLVAFKEAMAARGWKDGTHIVIEERWAEGRDERLPALAEELAAHKPAIVVAGTLSAATPAAKVLPRTPIVIAVGGDPVAVGLVKSFARPGGLITGITNFRTDLAEKYVELLVAAVPKLKRVGFLSYSKVPPALYAQYMDAARRSVAQYSIEARYADAGTAEEIDLALSRLATEGAQALVVLTGGGLFQAERARIVKLALARRWPVITGNREFVEEGALLNYGINISENYRRAAYYVDRILRGTKPGDLPIEQPTRVELVVNMKTAKALGLTIPQSILVRAEQVIE